MRRARALKLANRICRRRSLTSTREQVHATARDSSGRARPSPHASYERQRQWMARKLEQLREQHERLLYACGRLTIVR